MFFLLFRKEIFFSLKILNILTIQKEIKPTKDPNLNG